jgi:amino acid adenylation domain-containing protein
MKHPFWLLEKREISMMASHSSASDHSDHDPLSTLSLPEQPVSEKHPPPLLTDLQAPALAQDGQPGLCIPQLIAAQAGSTPYAPAVVSGKRALSYAALNARANQLAHHLQALGIGPDVPVGLCAERSLEMVVGLLGIMKAGGAYVPLDPQYPQARLAFMLNDVNAPVLVTQRHLAGQLPEARARVICLEDEPTLAGQSTREPPFLAGPDHLVYIIYTSGSTGQPKGVQITHKSLLNLISWHQQAFNVTAADRATQIASPAFDATGWELWPYLCYGASVYLVDEQVRALPAALRDWLVSHQITVSFLPTALAESLLTLDWPTETALRFLLTGADTLHQYPDASLPFALVNNYGPTEATVVATSARILPARETGALPSIGRPIANTEVYLLDEQLQPVDQGQPGEVHIGGVGLARGYLHQPELTRERFIPHPFSSAPDTRLYKTGDLARFLPDGQLAFLGRVDHQIKIRGFRIELDEIAAALNSHPDIQASFVVAHEEPAGEKRLVAYIVPTPQARLALAPLLETLKALLPDYMIPAVFVQLEALPITPNGKIDRAALPAPDETNTLHDQPFAAPGTPTEAKIAATVAALLNVERVGINDNFFLLGGHSMLGAQLIAWVAETFGLELPLRALFEASTVRQLANEVERQLANWLAAMSDEDAQRLLEEKTSD